MPQPHEDLCVLAQDISSMLERVDGLQAQVEDDLAKLTNRLGVVDGVISIAQDSGLWSILEAALVERASIVSRINYLQERLDNLSTKYAILSKVSEQLKSSLLDNQDVPSIASGDDTPSEVVPIQEGMLSDARNSIKPLTTIIVFFLIASIFLIIVKNRDYLCIWKITCLVTDHQQLQIINYV